jgi:predicted O-methyltransferase YrrM
MIGGKLFQIRGAEVLYRLPLRREYVFLAEVGVHIGLLSKFLLQSRDDLVFFGVDIWGEGREDHKNLAERVVTPYKDRANLLQMPSVEAAKLFYPDSLDMVFIDADHSYEAVKDDVLAWLPMVRRGGYIGGHDYNYPGTGVRKAVDEFEDSKILTIVEHGANYTWFSRK